MASILGRCPDCNVQLLESLAESSTNQFGYCPHCKKTYPINKNPTEQAIFENNLLVRKAMSRPHERCSNC